MAKIPGRANQEGGLLRFGKDRRRAAKSSATTNGIQSFFKERKHPAGSQRTIFLKSLLHSKESQKMAADSLHFPAKSGNREPGKCLEGTYVKSLRGMSPDLRASGRNGCGRVRDASRTTIEFEETDASRTRPQSFLPGKRA
eukprot:gene15057-biopygen21686